jgi:hypothetical protein
MSERLAHVRKINKPSSNNLVTVSCDANLFIDIFVLVLRECLSFVFMREVV